MFERIGFTFILLVMFLAACDNNAAVHNRIDDAPKIGTTPRGMLVKAEAGVTAGPEQMAAIDEGTARVFGKAQCIGYAIGLNAGRYQAVLLKADGVRDGVPYIAIPVGKYKGTEFDHNGKQFMAGEFIEPNTLVFVVAGALPALDGVAEHEMTHAMYFLNNKAKYNETKIHTAGQEFDLPPCKAPP